MSLSSPPLSQVAEQQAILDGIIRSRDDRAVAEVVALETVDEWDDRRRREQMDTDFAAALALADSPRSRSPARARARSRSRSRERPAARSPPRAAARAAPNNGAADEDCAICLCKMKAREKRCRVGCPMHHVFHDRCVKKWLRGHNTCPVCRGEVAGTTAVTGPVSVQ